MNINKYLKPGQSINVTADAGTGKTWIIISKILRLLLEGESPEKITAITFTKKASAEMRDRLNEKISNWAYKDEENLIKELKEIGINKDINNYLKSAKKLFTKLQLDNKDIRICTFDSFFTEILSQLYLENDIFNNFEINDKLNSKLFSQEVENKIFTNKYIEKNKNFQENLRFLINHVGSFDSIKKSVIGIVEKKNYYLEISNKKNFINKKFFDKNKKFLDYKKNFINNIHSLFIENNFQNIFPELDLEYIFLNKNDEQVIEKICSIFFTKNRTIKKNNEKILKKNNIDIELFLQEIYKFEEKNFFLIQDAWKELSNTFFTEYQNSLERNNLYDFSDKTSLCFNNLAKHEDESWIFYKIANSINHLLIDEFQDTNYIQWKIIKIILNAVHSLGENSSVTIVGDEKQSIYGFRGSEPKLFHIAKKYNNDRFGAIDLYLNQSRRSSENIVDFVNIVFPNVKNFNTKLKNDNEVSINCIGNDSEKLNIKDMILKETNFIARQIKSLVEDKGIKYHDIMILVRGRTHIKDMEDILISNSIPTSTNLKKTLLDNKEINDIYLLLRHLILDHEETTGDLYSVLISPIFNFPVNEVNKININNINDIKNFIEKSKYNNLYNNWKSLVGLIPMHDLIDKIYSDLDITKLYAGDNKIKNIEINNNFLNFVNMALKMNHGRFLTPFQFLCHIEKIKDIKQEIESIDSDCVKIQTIHSAKGLESKVVILAQTYRKTTNNKDIIFPIFNDDLGCEDLIYNPNIFKNNPLIEKIFYKNVSKRYQEEENLLYVACTRAMEILIVNGFKEKNSWFTNSLFFE